VCREDELPPGSMKLVPIGKFGVGVFNVDGTYKGLTNYCPHEGGPLCAGNIRGTTEIAPTPRQALGGSETVRSSVAPGTSGSLISPPGRRCPRRSEVFVPTPLRLSTGWSWLCCERGRMQGLVHPFSQ
jgi:hypothetical protein